MVLAPDSRLELSVSVKGEGPPILCLHGHPGSSQSMSVFTSCLSNHYRTVTPDLRGYGQSRATCAFKMSDHLDDLEALWDRYDLDNCIILGWSLGGIVAMELAMRQPERIGGLILVATAARPRSTHPPVTWRDNLYTAIAGLINGVIPGWTWNIKTFGVRSLFRYLICRHTPIAYQYLAREALPAYLQTSRHATAALNRAIASGYSRLNELSLIDCPCLMLSGECDVHITAASSQETAHHLQCSDYICYPNTAHLFPWENPKQVQEDVFAWLQRLNSNRINE